MPSARPSGLAPGPEEPGGPAPWAAGTVVSGTGPVATAPSTGTATVTTSAGLARPGVSPQAAPDDSLWAADADESGVMQRCAARAGVVSESPAASAAAIQHPLRPAALQPVRMTDRRTTGRIGTGLVGRERPAGAASPMLVIRWPRMSAPVPCRNGRCRRGVAAPSAGGDSRPTRGDIQARPLPRQGPYAVLPQRLPDSCGLAQVRRPRADGAGAASIPDRQRS